MNRNLVIGFSLIINKFFGLTYNLYKRETGIRVMAQN